LICFIRKLTKLNTQITHATIISQHWLTKFFCIYDVQHANDATMFKIYQMISFYATNDFIIVIITFETFTCYRPSTSQIDQK